MTKTRLTGGSILVTFELPAAAAAAAVSVCGDFNDWSPTSHQLTRTDNGSFQATLELPTGRRWRFRYLLDGQRWENDWAADDYLPNGHGGDDSVVDLTDTSALPLTPVPAAEAAGRTDIADPVAAAGVPAAAGSATSEVEATAGVARARRTRAGAGAADSGSTAPPTPRTTTTAGARTGRRTGGDGTAEPAGTGRAEGAGKASKAAKGKAAESAGKTTEEAAPKATSRPSTPRKKSAPPVEQADQAAV